MFKCFKCGYKVLETGDPIPREPLCKCTNEDAEKEIKQMAKKYVKKKISQEKICLTWKEFKEDICVYGGTRGFFKNDESYATKSICLNPKNKAKDCKYRRDCPIWNNKKYERLV